MIVYKGQYWLEICNEEYYNPKNLYQEDIDGFWVAYLYRNIQFQNSDIENTIKRLVLNKSIKAAKLGMPYFERLIVFTSCDKKEIYNVKQIILRNVNVKEEHLFWKANYESEQAWEEHGYLSEVNKVMSLYEKYLVRAYPEYKNKKQLYIQRCKMYQKITEDILKMRTDMVVRPVFGNIKYDDIIPNSIFLIMPFEEEWSDEIFDVLQDISNTTNCKLIRTDIS